MSRRQFLLFLGIWIIIVPFLGFPSTWKTILLVLTGLCLVAFSYRLPAPERKEVPETHD